ncbi:putative reverse transcriptase domain-containing protein [Tanacetum coccineum]
MDLNQKYKKIKESKRGYYRRFIENFSKIAKPLTLLTQKNKTYVWGDKQDEAFQILKEKLCNAPVLALFDGPDDFVVYCDASKQGFGCRHALDMVKADWIVHVTDLGKRDYIQVLINGPYPQDFPRILPWEKPVCVVVSLLGLWYPKGSGFDLKAYSDSDYTGCNLDRKSISGGCQILRGKLMKSQLADYDILYDKVPIFCDNTSVIAISNNPVLHSITKHIDIRALTLQPSAMYVEYLKEFWYTAEVEEETKTITFLLS